MPGKTSDVGALARLSDWIQRVKMIFYCFIHIKFIALGLGPLFSVRDVAGRLDAGDATYVEAIHTDGGLFGAGIGAPIADADYFPNGGSSQSGCFIVSCSHFRAVTFYVESIQHNRFFALRCSARDNISSLRCR